MATISILIALSLLHVGIASLPAANQYYSSNYYPAGTVGFNPAYNPYNQHYGTYRVPDAWSPYHQQQFHDTTTTTESTTTIPTTTTTTTTVSANTYDFSNMRFLCHLTGNWNLQVENGWLQMQCMYDYIDLLKLLHESLPIEGFLNTKVKLDNAWLLSGSIYHRDGFVSICKRYCDAGTWPIIRNENMTNADLPMRSYLNIGCTNLNDEHCEPICDEEIRKVDDGTVSCTKGLFLSSKCELRCDYGYYPTGHTLKSCDSNTKRWTPSDYPFKCKAYSSKQLMSVVSMIPEEDLEDEDLSNRKSLLNVILTKFLSSNKTQEELNNDPSDMHVKNQVLGKIIQAFYNETKPGSIVLKSFNTEAAACNGEPKSRLECGFPGITKEQCINTADCCYDDTVPDVKWCFKKNIGRGFLKDTTTKIPNQQTYNDVRITSRSPGSHTTFGTMGGGDDLLNMLETMGLRQPSNPFSEAFGGLFNKKNNKIEPFPQNSFQAKCKCENAAMRNLATSCGVGVNNGQAIARIICGTPTLPEKWPWHVIIYYGTSVCGGTLVDNRFVVTAAHCFGSKKSDIHDRDSRNKLFFGVANVHQQNGKEQVSGIKSIRRHPQFFQDGMGRLKNDIAVVELETPIKVTETVRPICLTQGRKPTIENGHRCFVTGFGKTGEDASLSARLRYAELPIVESRRCLSMYNADNEVNSVLCAGKIGSQSADTCKGDSGGPLFCTTDMSKPHTDTCAWYLAGVTSFGQTPCGQGFPGVYTNIAHYDNWIRQQMLT